MSRRTHLEHPSYRGPTCQRGRIGGALRGEHITVKYADFKLDPLRCSRCEASKVFKFLQKKEQQREQG